MLFIGRTFCNGRNTLDYTSTDVKNINRAKIQNGIYDDVYASRNIDRGYSVVIPSDWDYDTVLRAKFQNSINAGNIDFILNQLSSIKIKRRVEGTYDWITLFEIPIKNAEDLSFERFDKYGKSKVEYEYSAVPVINDIDGNGKSVKILSEFNGFYITEKEQMFGTILDIDIETQKNRPNTVLNPASRKYAYVVSNGQSNYYGGTSSGVFIECDDNTHEFKVQEGWKYREQFMEFLQNGKSKILKYDDGRMWIISVTDTPTESTDGHPDKIKTTFNWVETDDCSSGSALFNNNFIDVDQ